MCEIEIERLETENRILRIRLEQADREAKTWKDAYEKQVELMNRIFNDDDDCFND